jgi:MFS superfamily sulfate permease-like transporter
MAQPIEPIKTIEVPKSGLIGLKENFFADFRAGLSISLIALPLSLGIALASNFPAFAGLIAAVVGGMIVSRISGSYVTINGSAAGLIVANLAAVQRLGGGDLHAGYLYVCHCRNH